VARGRAVTAVVVPGLGRFLDRAERVLFSIPLWLLAAGLLLVSILTNGIWHTPDIADFVAMAHEFPRAPFLGGGDYILGSPLGPAIAGTLGLRTTLPYVLFHLGVVLAAFAGLVVVVRMRFGDLAARAATVALFCSPLSNLLLTWLGQPDAFTFAFATALVVLDWPPLLLLAGVGLGLSGFEQGLFVAAGAVAVRWIDERRRTTRPAITSAAIVVGLLAGKVLLEAYHRRYGIHPQSRLDFVLMVGFARWFGEFFGNFPTWLFSIFNALWVFLAAVYLRHRRSLRVPALLLVALVAPVFVTLDQTRVYALVSWPVVLWAVLWATRDADAGDDPAVVRRLLTITLLLGLVLPRIMVWESNTYASSIRLLTSWLAP
jgi:hypothetical protein